MWKLFSNSSSLDLGISMGLTIGKSNIAFALTKNDDQNAFQTINQGVIEYTSSDPLETALQKLQTQYELQDLNCYWVLSANEYQILLIDKPKVLPSEYRQAALWQIKELLSFPIDDCVIDVFLPAEDVVAYHEKLHVIAAKKTFLSRIVETLHSLNISVESIITQEFAIRNIVTMLNIPDKTIGALSYSDGFYFLTIIKNSNVLFSRRIVINLENEIARSLEYCTNSLKQDTLSKLIVIGLLEETKLSLREFIAQFDMSIEYLELSQLIISHQSLSTEMVYAIGGSLESRLKNIHGNTKN